METPGEARKQAESPAPSNSSSNASGSSPYKPKTRARKRKRISSDSDIEDVMPENTIEMEKTLCASALKNNLDDASVKKILKKVVTNDHVLALVKLREEEEEDEDSSMEDLRPKLTRAKAKELMKVSPKSSAPWNLDNLELSPIKHIPVKTRPEVQALIDQELPDHDDHDEEYHPANDEAASDDDQTDMSYSDMESQPRTPATPRAVRSPAAHCDGPFKVPQEIKTPRRLVPDSEEATIALRTRSKLSLSETPIEHIESSFIPPDELPLPIVDDLWNQFLEECLNPASTSRHEDDDDADPDFAADPDAHEDDEALESSLIKISKKELNDLVTELFHIMPEELSGKQAALTPGKNGDGLITSGDQSGVSGELFHIMPEELSGKQTALTPGKKGDGLITSVDQSGVSGGVGVSGHWEGKQEPVSDDEVQDTGQNKENQDVRNRRASVVSIGKSEPPDLDPTEDSAIVNGSAEATKDGDSEFDKSRVQIESTETGDAPRERSAPLPVPPLLQERIEKGRVTHQPVVVELPADNKPTIFPGQILILKQQLRQHIQMATANFLQLYIHPEHWASAPTYKDFLEQLKELYEKNANSVANVCNLKPALELVHTWEQCMSQDTPENHGIVEFQQKEIAKQRRKVINNGYYIADFHHTYLQVIANSSVFLYPHLLPHVPYRCDNVRRAGFTQAEDELIALGLDMFWDYVEQNPEMFKLYRVKPVPNRRVGLGATVTLVAKHMFPWIGVRSLANHISKCRKANDPDNPIYRFFRSRDITPVKHQLLPYNSNITLYQQPVKELPYIWLKHVAQTSRRAKKLLLMRKSRRHPPTEPVGVDVDLAQSVELPEKNPLPSDFTKVIRKRRNGKYPPEEVIEKIDVHINTLIPTKSNLTNDEQEPNDLSTMFRVEKTEKGARLVPIHSQILDTELDEDGLSINEDDIPPIEETSRHTKHCKCCQSLRRLQKTRQTTIVEYFKPKSKRDARCPCGKRKTLKITNRLRILVSFYNSRGNIVRDEIEKKIGQINGSAEDEDCFENSSEEDDRAYATCYQLKLLSRLSTASAQHVKKFVQYVLSVFNAGSDCPKQLARQLCKEFGDELQDMYKEFLGFLTADQAEELGGFKDHFVSYSASRLLRKIDEHIPDERLKRGLLTFLSDMVSRDVRHPCTACCGILSHVTCSPELARYTFSLFPHPRTLGPQSTKEPLSPKNHLTQREPRSPSVQVLTKRSQTVRRDASGALVSTTNEHYEDAGSSEDEGADENGDKEQEPTKATAPAPATKVIIERPADVAAHEVIDTPELTITKTEIQDGNESDSEIGEMLIMSEDDCIKEELAEEWKKEEDKVLLEILKEHLASDRKKSGTVLQALDDMNVYSVLGDSLEHRTEQDIRDRVAYLLELIGFGGAE